MILVDSSYDCGKNEVLFVKIGAMVLDLKLDASFAKGFEIAQISFKALDLKSQNFLMSSFMTFCMKQALTFKF